MQCSEMEVRAGKENDEQQKQCYCNEGGEMGKFLPQNQIRL